MLSSIAFWVAVAILVFWAIGAYNRLVRLRAQATVSFAALDRAFARQVELVLNALPPPAADGATRPAELDDPVHSLWLGLRASAHQFSACLAALRLRPLAPGEAAALATAWQVLEMAWCRLQQDVDLAGPALPESISSQWLQLNAQQKQPRDDFNQSVMAYNQAIGEFPAILLAWLFNFQPGRPV